MPLRLAAHMPIVTSVLDRTGTSLAAEGRAAAFGRSVGSKWSRARCWIRRRSGARGRQRTSRPAAGDGGPLTPGAQSPRGNMVAWELVASRSPSISGSAPCLSRWRCRGVARLLDCRRPRAWLARGPAGWPWLGGRRRLLSSSLLDGRWSDARDAIHAPASN